VIVGVAVGIPYALFRGAQLISEKSIRLLPVSWPSDVLFHAFPDPSVPSRVPS